MSLSKNRILKNSVSFSNDTYQLTYDDALPAGAPGPNEEELVLQGEQQRLEAERRQLQQEAQQLEQYRRQLEQQQEELQQQLTKVMRTRQAHEEEMREQREQEKQAMFYQFADHLWDHSLQLAERIVGQAIDARSISMTEMLKRAIESLPVAFEKLTITVHPSTQQWLKSEEIAPKDRWLLELVEWKFDFSLQPGEFVIEEQKEFFEYRFRELFAQLREQWESQKDFEE